MSQRIRCMSNLYLVFDFFFLIKHVLKPNEKHHDTANFFDQTMYICTLWRATRKFLNCSEEVLGSRVNGLSRRFPHTRVRFFHQYSFSRVRAAKVHRVSDVCVICVFVTFSLRTQCVILDLKFSSSHTGGDIIQNKEVFALEILKQSAPLKKVMQHSISKIWRTNLNKTQR